MAVESFLCCGLCIANKAFGKQAVGLDLPGLIGATRQQRDTAVGRAARDLWGAAIAKLKKKKHLARHELPPAALASHQSKLACSETRLRSKLRKLKSCLPTATTESPSGVSLGVPLGPPGACRGRARFLSARTTAPVAVPTPPAQPVTRTLVRSGRALRCYATEGLFETLRERVQKCQYVHARSLISHPQPSGTYPPGSVLSIGSVRVVVERFLAEGGFAHVYVVLVGGDQIPAVLKRIACADEEALDVLKSEIEFMVRCKALRRGLA
ncbi:hypothetical protein BDK51DRAFT_45340 [Blyttiomyces helicus]|uniref:non-specific serine/threonine protein kinase n=1 Tax=Blyttiomyces helicus TaxID=388810 RepID=A0A4V1IQ30_9FUNG|nr:hypothetical protein BDK51DRAFT_45340 [Blyttiomyces helicus]|eukprot:RKO85127.1 hypothetical protein BDK51DRAFT_45340 [Blyttiomyces helicus]